MFKKPTDESDVENVGIMQGFMDEDDDLDYAEYMKEEEVDEDSDMAGIMNRQPNSPEILMNNLRGDMRSIDARVEELADLVGYNAAAETPQDVLALLQPVFAAQQAPAMPQGMPPQGAMPPQAMPPEMMGGIPQEAMPAEMMPQEMPPEMMGGIGALPADQGPEMGAPVMMAKGGPVQYFNEGSDEDGVTPDDGTSSFARLLPAEVVTAAQERYLSRMNQRPLVTPDLATEVERRTPMYEKLLGVDNNLSQAQILFELGQRAFNFGANVDDQGKPLRGSAAARLAGAVRTLPGSIGQITGQMDQQRRAVRGAALQASEKGIQNILESNAKLAESQRKGDVDIIKSMGKGAVDKGFGTGMEGTAQTVLYQLAPDYAAGTLSPELTRKYESALTIATQPVQFTDPRTGQVTTRQPQLPAYVAKAVQERQANLTGVTPSTPQAVEEKVRSLASQYEANKKKFENGQMSRDDFYNSSSEIQMKIDQATASISEQPRGVIKPPEDTSAAKDAPKKKSDKKALSPFENLSLIDLSKFVTGPGASFKRGISNIPSLGSSFPDTTQATAFYETAINRIVTALKTTDRFGNMERTEIKKELGLDPALYQDEALLKNKLLGLGDFIKQQRDEASGLSKRTDINVDISKNAEVVLQEMNRALEIIYGKGPKGMPDNDVVPNKPIKVYSTKELEGLPSGTRILWNGVVPKTVR
jgi:hypothetical protein